MDKTYKHIILFFFMLFVSLTVYPQTNVVGIETLRCGAGKEVNIPVALTNYDEVVALQLKLELPFAMDEDSECRLSDRSNGHSISVRRLSGNTYLFVIFSASNKPVRGGAGDFFYIPMRVPESCIAGEEYKITCSQQIISDVEGRNICNADFEEVAVVITDEPRPDLKVGAVCAAELSVVPGGRISLSWTVTNVGDLNTSGGWKENVSLVSVSGERCFLGTVYHEGTLHAGGEISRQADFNIPSLPGIDGKVSVEVTVVADKDCGELPVDEGNNTAWSENSLELAGVLSFEMPASAISENYSSPIACKLYRSGSRAANQTFKLFADDAARLQLPEEVEIKAGQSGSLFYISVKDNDILDEDSLVTVSASGCGYDLATAVVRIEDDELPKLSVEFSKNMIEEGEAVTLTVTAERALSVPLTVFLSCDYSKRFTFPSQVVIPQGGKSASVEVTAVDDNLPDMMIDATFTAVAEHYESGEGYVMLDDDDVPEIELILTPHSVAESAGSAAVIGKLRRTTNKESKVTVVLTDNADGELIYSSKKIVLEPGVEENMFVLGVKDNNVVDGTRVYDVTASVYISSCNCSASGTTAGTVSQKITICDDDGPALGVKASKTVVLEGATAVLTLSRNTSVNDVLIVSITSDNDDCLEYEHEVAFPVGAASIDIPVVVKKNDVSGDDRTVTFTVSGENFSDGTCWMMITDRTLPDAYVSGLTLSSFNVEAKGTADLMIKVANGGEAFLPAKTKLSVYFNGYLYTTLYTGEDIAPGESEIISESIDMPDLTGDYTMKVVVNESQTVNELFYGNNSSEQITVRLLPRFTATVSSDKSVYAPGEKIVLKGQASGSAVANTEVDIYVVNAGYRHVLKATTDDQGAFTAEYTPYAGQIGHFTVGACYPNEKTSVAQAEFDVVGLKIISGNNEYIKVEQGMEYKGSICISNPTEINLSDMKISVVSIPSGCSFDYNEVVSIPAKGKVYLNYVLKSDVVTTVNSWQNIKLRLSNEQISDVDLNLSYYCLASTPKLESDVESVTANMVKNEIRECIVNITNVGRGKTGTLTLALPDADWISADRTSFPSLTYGESVALKFKLHPTEDMPYNSTYKTRIAVVGHNGCSFVWDADFKVVGHSLGRIELDVIDEYTFYTDDAPHVDSAAVVIKEPYSNEIVDVGFSGKDGHFVSKELPCGTYYCYVGKAQHEDAAFVMTVEPEGTAYKTVSLLYAPIKYSWNVVKDEMTDEYRFTLNTTFETNVPTPVVVIDFEGEIPDNMSPGDSVTVVAMITNHGLVAADNVMVRAEEHDYFTATPLITSLGTLHAKTTQAIPVVITRKVLSETKIRKAPGIRCTFTPSISLYSTYRRRCNFETAEWEYYDVRGDVPLPTLELNCHITLPELPIRPVETDTAIIRRFPDFFGDYPVVPYPVNPEPEIPPIPWNELDDIFNNIPSLDINSNRGLPFMLELRGCQRECVEQLGEIAVGLASDGETPRTRIARFNACVDRLQSGWSIGVWIRECANPYLQQMARVLAQNMAAESRMARVPVQNQTVENETESEKKIEELTEDIEFLEYIDNVVNDKENDYDEKINKIKDNLVPDAIESKVDSTDFVKDFIDELEGNVLTDKSRNKLIDKYKTSLLDKEDVYAIFNRWDESLAKWGTAAWTVDLIDVDEMISDIDFIHSTDKYASDMGFVDYIDLYLHCIDSFTDIYFKYQPKGCTKVAIQFAQNAVMTREVVKGYLNIENTNDVNDITDIELKISVLDRNGKDCTHLFQIDPAYETDGILLTEGKGRIKAGKTGTYTILFVPNKNAAPETSADYRFTGYFSYNSPYTGERSSHTLMPVTLSVSPSPSLDVDFFIPRDVFADDPLTEAVEKSVPAEMAVLINNIGYGDAKNVNFSVQQPQIVSNEKGLAIDMKIVGSSFNGTDKTVSLGTSAVTDFGTIPAMTTAYAQWWLESSLLGHFTDYDVSATHVTSFGNEDLPLLNNVAVHELIHSVRDVSASGENLAGFLVNDIIDAEDLPDMLYLSDGTVEKVDEVVSASCRANGSSEYVLTLDAASDGWGYAVVSDPTRGRMTLSSVRRSDGSEVDVHNFWQTYCTLRDGKEPLYENRLHLVDRMNSGTSTYTLTYVPSLEQFEVSIMTDGYGGTVCGAVDGMYDYGTTLTLVAVPEEGYVLKSWTVNGEDMGSVEVFSVMIEQDTEILAVFEKEEVSTLDYALAEGWNWISHGLKSDVSISVFGNKVERIVAQTEEVVNDSEYGLVGNLSVMRPLEAYKVKLASGMDIAINGYKLDATRMYVNLRRGWNWMGCPVDYACTLADAFLGSVLEEGDAVCGQDGYAVYENGEWCGTLDVLVSGNGYLYKSVSDKRLFYNTDLSYSSKLFGRQELVGAEGLLWSADKHKYPNTMNITSDLYMDEVKVEPDVFHVGAFCGEECRGVGKYVQGMLYLTVYGEGGEAITYKAVDCYSGKLWDIEECSSFVADVIGSRKHPYLFHLLDDNTGMVGNSLVWKISPSTTTDNIYVSSGIGHVDEITITSSSGTVVLSIKKQQDGAPISLARFSPGVYVVYAKSGGHIYRKKIVKY